MIQSIQTIQNFQILSNLRIVFLAFSFFIIDIKKILNLEFNCLFSKHEYNSLNLLMIFQIIYSILFI